MSGQTGVPFWPWTVGGAKQLGLKYCPDVKPCRGSQVRTGTMGVLMFEPKRFAFERLPGYCAFRLPFVLGWMGAPLWTWVMPEITHPFTTFLPILSPNELPFSGLGRLTIYDALKICVRSYASTPSLFLRIKA